MTNDISHSLICTLILALCALTPQVGGANPWPRAEGNVFISYDLSLSGTTPRAAVENWSDAGHLGAYAEYGLGAGWTLGGAYSATSDQQIHTIFLRYTLTPTEAVWQGSIDAGLGWHQTANGRETPLIRLGAAVGRGISADGVGTPGWLRLAGAWTSLSAHTLYGTETGTTLWKAEGTLGLRLESNHLIIGQLIAEDRTDAEFATHGRASVTLPVSAVETLELGAQTSLIGPSRTDLFMGLWLEF